MHTLETAVVLPLILLIVLGGIGLSVATLGLLDVQSDRYCEVGMEDSSACVQVLRVTEVVYETIQDLQK